LIEDVPSDKHDAAFFGRELAELVLRDAYSISVNLVPELVIEFLMWCRRHRRVISPPILAAPGAPRDRREDA
jgi:hypothetical protein